jgi:hypothetical protein
MTTATTTDIQSYGNSRRPDSIEGCQMVFHPRSTIVALRALLAVTWAEERRLRTIITSEQTSADEVSMALNVVSKLWSRVVLKLTDIEDATVTSACSHLPANCNPEQSPRLPVDRQVGNVHNGDPIRYAPSETPPNSASGALEVPT